MKHLLFCLLLGITCGLYGQTTVEEYNYLTKGYKIQVESGLDMKKGYRFESVGEWSRTTTQGFSSMLSGAEYLFLIREGEKVPCATLVIYRKKGSTDRYFCIPHMESEENIWDLAETSFTSSGLATYENAGLLMSMVKMISFLASRE